MDYNNLSSNSSYIGQFNDEVVFHSTLYTSEQAGYLTNRCLIDTVLYNLYDTNDLRKSIFFKKNGTAVTFKGNYSNDASRLFCGIAVDEMFLIRAETLARKNKVTEAMNDLNTLLMSRWVKDKFTPHIALTSKEAISEILLERRKELLLRGVRWTDLRRLNMEEDYETILTRKIDGQIYTLEPNSFKYTFPLPDDVIQLSGMPQTIDW